MYKQQLQAMENSGHRKTHSVINSGHRKTHSSENSGHGELRNIGGRWVTLVMEMSKCLGVGGGVHGMSAGS